MFFFERVVMACVLWGGAITASWRSDAVDVVACDVVDVVRGFDDVVDVAGGEVSETGGNSNIGAKESATDWMKIGTREAKGEEDSTIISSA